MAYALQRVEKPLLRGRVVYVRNQVYSVYEALLNILEQSQTVEEEEQEDWWSMTEDSDDTFKSSTSTTTGRATNNTRRRRRVRDVSYTSRPHSSECVISVEEDPVDPLRSIAWGRNDHLRTLFDLLTLRDAIISHSLLQGIIYGAAII
ncbi:hypothetical protein GNI_040380, partial [Gregarina niphandrodes]